MLHRIFRRRIGLDRMLVQGKFSTVCRLLLVVLGVSCFVYVFLLFLERCGWFGVSNLMTNETQEDPSLIWSVLYHVMDPGNQFMASPGIGRFFAFLLALFGCIFMNGLLMSSFIGWYERFVDEWKCGMARYSETLKRKRFIIIIGAHEAVPSMIRQLFKRYGNLDYIVVQTNRNVEEVRRHFLSFLTAAEEKKVIIYAGDRTSKDDLRDLHVEYARELFIVGESLEDCAAENNHDALNMNCLQILAEQLREFRKADKEKLSCRVVFEYQTSFSIFQYSEVSENIKDIIDFKPMNFYESWAQRIFVKDKLEITDKDLFGYLPLEGQQPIREDCEDTVHLIIVGMSRMGVALGIEAARLAHYPNFVKDSSRKTRITFIDPKCDVERKYFQGRFKELFSLANWRELKEGEDASMLYEGGGWHNRELLDARHYLGHDFIDVEWEFITRGVEDRDVHDYLQAVARDKRKRLNVAICLPNDNNSVAAALYLPEEVYENAVQVLVFQYHNSSVIDSVTCNKKNLYYRKLKAFGMMKDAYDDHLVQTQEYVAGILKQQYGRMYEEKKKELGIADVEVKVTRGKSSIAKSWSDVYNANSIWSKLRSVDYVGSAMLKVDDVRVLAETEHNRWTMEQLLMRFRALTPEEQEKASQNPEYKEELKGCKMAHLDICSWDRLKEIDPSVICFDKGFIEILPKIVDGINKA